MFDEDPPKQEDRVDYTGLKIGAILLPVFLLVTYFANADMGLTVFIVFGVMMVAIKLRWNLRRRIWFWAIVVFILILEVPLFFLIRWPQGKGPTFFYAMPFGIADFLVISGALRLAEKIFSKNASEGND